MSRLKAIIFLGDGMADEPVPALGGLTPLQRARRPGMNRLASEGRLGTLLTLPGGFPTSSEVANMSVLGCDLATEYTGRGPLEALGRGLTLGAGDVAFRLNLTTVCDGVLSDYSAGHVPQEAAAELMEWLNARFRGSGAVFHSGVSYRNLLILSGGAWSDRVRTEKPDDNQGNRVEDHLPLPIEPAAGPTAEFLAGLMRDAGGLLDACPANVRLCRLGRPPANGLWPWSGGRGGAMRSLRERHGVLGAVISAVDVINGLGRALGMDVIRVPGATGYTDTNYEGKAEAALRALETHDLVYLHLEAIDEVSHERDLARKIEAIEAFDARIIRPVTAGAGPDVRIALLPDHPVPVLIGRHTRTPVPVAVRIPGVRPDGIECFDEASALSGSLGSMRDGDLMRLLLAPTPA